MGGGGQILTGKNLNKKVRCLIEQQQPMMVSRLGSVELENIIQYHEVHYNIRHDYEENTKKKLHFNAGFFPFPSDKDVEQFTQLYIDALRDVDVFGCWYNRGEDFLIREYCKKDIILGRLGDLEPWNNPSNPWSAALENKKVLFVHPFTDTIQLQIPKREFIFPGTQILPPMDVKLLKAVQTIAGEKDSRFESWFEALQWMLEEAMSKDFDIAIIGCGAYGLPLASMLKRNGKQAIHLGGATQLFWGIRGGRWDTRPEFQKLFNDAWVCPLESDRVENCMSVENGCYW